MVHARGAVHGGELHPRGIVGETHLLQHQHAVFHIDATSDVAELHILIQCLFDGGFHIDVHSEGHYERGISVFRLYLLRLLYKGVWGSEAVGKVH